MKTDYFDLLTKKEVLRAFWRGLREATFYSNGVDVNDLIKRATVFDIVRFVEHLAYLDPFAYQHPNQTKEDQTRNVYRLALTWASPRHPASTEQDCYYTRLCQLASDPLCAIAPWIGFRSVGEWTSDVKARQRTLGWKTDRYAILYKANPWFDFDWDWYYGVGWNPDAKCEEISEHNRPYLHRILLEAVTFHHVPHAF